MNEPRSTPAFAIGGVSETPWRPRLQPGQFEWLVDGYVAMPRELAEACKDLVERVLAFSGDQPDRALITLQHDLADLLRPPASTQPERSTQT
jgi:hypothetical protein